MKLCCCLAAIMVAVLTSVADSDAKVAYLDLMERAIGAYSDPHLAAYIADVDRDGVQEHGFPRLAANLATFPFGGTYRHRGT